MQLVGAVGNATNEYTAVVVEVMGIDDGEVTSGHALVTSLDNVPNIGRNSVGFDFGANTDRPTHLKIAPSGGTISGWWRLVEQF